VAVVALILSSILLSNSLAAFDWDGTVFIGFGEGATATREYGEERLGEVFLRAQQGHDGKFFFIQANDPWLLDPAANAELLQPPLYRSQRMLYPLLAGGFGLLGPEAIVWGLLIVNVLGMALGTLATSRLAKLLGGSPWWGLAFALNFGLVFDLENDGAGIVAAALALWAVVMIYESRHGLAIGLLAGAVLTREVMLVCVVGAAICLWLEGRRRLATLTLAVPAAVFGAWTIYLRVVLGPDEVSAGALGLPFVGLVRAIPSWLEEPVTLLAGVSVIVLLALLVRQWVDSGSALSWVFVGFVPLATVLTERVWTEIFDFTRALAPVLTAGILLIFVEGRNSASPALRARSELSSGQGA
jgi:hypothetical protein